MPTAAPADTARPAAPSTPSAPPTATGSAPDLSDLTRSWDDGLLAALPQRARARFSGGHWVSAGGGEAVFGLPNAPHAARCEEVRGEVESVIAARFGAPVSITLVVDGSAPDPSAPRGANARRAVPDPVDDEVDLDDLVDAHGVHNSGIDRIAAAFPGAELVDEP